MNDKQREEYNKQFYMKMSQKYEQHYKKYLIYLHKIQQLKQYLAKQTIPTGQQFLAMQQFQLKLMRHTQQQQPHQY